MKHKVRISKTWEHGSLVDTWSIVHLLTGAIGGMFLALLDVSSSQALVLSITGVILYELFEKIIRVGEAWPNALVDMLLGGGAAFAIFTLTQNTAPLSLELILMPAIVVDSILSYHGWRATLKRR